MTLPADISRHLDGVGLAVFRSLVDRGRPDDDAFAAATEAAQEKLFRFGTGGALVPDDADDARFARILGLVPELLEAHYPTRTNAEGYEGQSERFRARRLAITEAVLSRRLRGSRADAGTEGKEQNTVAGAKAELAELNAAPAGATIVEQDRRVSKRVAALQRLLDSGER